MTALVGGGLPPLGNLSGQRFTPLRLGLHHLGREQPLIGRHPRLTCARCIPLLLKRQDLLGKRDDLLVVARLDGLLERLDALLNLGLDLLQHRQLGQLAELPLHLRELLRGLGGLRGRTQRLIDRGSVGHGRTLLLEQLRQIALVTRQPRTLGVFGLDFFDGRSGRRLRNTPRRRRQLELRLPRFLHRVGPTKRDVVLPCLITLRFQGLQLLLNDRVAIGILPGQRGVLGLFLDLRLKICVLLRQGLVLVSDFKDVVGRLPPLLLGLRLLPLLVGLSLLLSGGLRLLLRLDARACTRAVRHAACRADGADQRRLIGSGAVLGQGVVGQDVQPRLIPLDGRLQDLRGHLGSNTDRSALGQHHGQRLARQRLGGFLLALIEERFDLRSEQRPNGSAPQRDERACRLQNSLSSSAPRRRAHVDVDRPSCGLLLRCLALDVAAQQAREAGRGEAQTAADDRPERPCDRRCQRAELGAGSGCAGRRGELGKLLSDRQRHLACHLHRRCKRALSAVDLLDLVPTDLLSVGRHRRTLEGQLRRFVGVAGNGLNARGGRPDEAFTPAPNGGKYSCALLGSSNGLNRRCFWYDSASTKLVKRCLLLKRQFAATFRFEDLLKSHCFAPPVTPRVFKRSSVLTLENPAAIAASCRSASAFRLMAAALCASLSSPLSISSCAESISALSAVTCTFKPLVSPPLLPDRSAATVRACASCA